MLKLWCRWTQEKHMQQAESCCARDRENSFGNEFTLVCVSANSVLEGSAANT